MCMQRKVQEWHKCGKKCAKVSHGKCLCQGCAIPCVNTMVQDVAMLWKGRLCQKWKIFVAELLQRCSNNWHKIVTPLLHLPKNQKIKNKKLFFHNVCGAKIKNFLRKVCIVFIIQCHFIGISFDVHLLHKGVTMDIQEPRGVVDAE